MGVPHSTCRMSQAFLHSQRWSELPRCLEAARRPATRGGAVFAMIRTDGIRYSTAYIDLMHPCKRQCCAMFGPGDEMR